MEKQTAIVPRNDTGYEEFFELLQKLIDKLLAKLLGSPTQYKLEGPQSS